MKNVLLLLAFLFIVFASACKKDPTPKYSYRLTEIVESRENINDIKIIFFYEGDRIVGWKDIDGTGSEFYVGIDYLSDNVVEFGFYLTDTTNSEIVDKIVYSFNGELIVKIEEFEKNGEAFVLSKRTSYEYNQNGDVKEKVSSYFVDSVETFFYKDIYSYNENLLAEMIKYQYFQESWRESTKISYQYGSGLLTSSVLYGYGNDIWNPYYKDEFVYSGNDGAKAIVTEINKYGFVDVDNWDLMLTTTYQYDNNENMIREVVSTSSTDNYTINYTYEAKSGNLWLFNFIKEYGYPNPIYSAKPISLFNRL